jgi:hypothetical protein
MDFELKNLEMIENTPYSTDTSPTPTTSGKTQSVILNELHKANDELQNKLKVNYRRLLLFEAENSKLIEEKNRLFFDTQHHIEKSKILEERNSELESENQEIDGKNQLLNEKIYALGKINATQLNELKRFSKFHLKIQNVVKPYILQLKSQISTLKKELHAAMSQLNLYKTLNENLEQAQTELQDKKDTAEKIYQIDKNNLISSYEEQIHSFSKEILALQSQNELHTKEISRLKKSVEFKNYFENELIKFKRIHEEDQSKYQHLLDQKNFLETEHLRIESALAEIKIDLSKTKLTLEEKENILEVTRTQLAKQIDASVIVNERLHRLEKLNNQLSREMSQPT